MRILLAIAILSPMNATCRRLNWAEGGRLVWATGFWERGWCSNIATGLAIVSLGLG